MTQIAIDVSGDEQVIGENDLDMLWLKVHRVRLMEVFIVEREDELLQGVQVCTGRLEGRFCTVRHVQDFIANNAP